MCVISGQKGEKFESSTVAASEEQNDSPVFLLSSWSVGHEVVVNLAVRTASNSKNMWEFCVIKTGR
jgi:hypothetical protein